MMDSQFTNAFYISLKTKSSCSFFTKFKNHKVINLNIDHHCSIANKFQWTIYKYNDYHR